MSSDRLPDSHCIVGHTYSQEWREGLSHFEDRSGQRVDEPLSLDRFFDSERRYLGPNTRGVYPVFNFDHHTIKHHTERA